MYNLYFFCLNFFFTWKWLDRRLVMMPYLVTIANDSRQTCVKMCPSLLVSGSGSGPVRDGLLSLAAPQCTVNVRIFLLTRHQSSPITPHETWVVLVKIHCETLKVVDILIPLWVYHFQCILHCTCILLISPCLRCIIHSLNSTGKPNIVTIWIKSSVVFIRIRESSVTCLKTC